MRQTGMQLRRSPARRIILLVISGAGSKLFATLGAVALGITLAVVPAVPAPGETREFQNTTALQIPADKPASLYPSSIDVSGVSGFQKEATVTLHGLSHENLKDLAVLLVGPGAGGGVVLMASFDRAGSGSYKVSDANPTFADLAGPVECSSREDEFPPIFPDEGRISPFNCGLAAPFPAPAPQEPYGDRLEEGTDGVWSLYVNNDVGDQEGRIAGGWSLNITTQGPFAPTDAIVPSISGTAGLGETLSCSDGSWLGNGAAVSFSYQWLRNGSPIAGATASSYVVQTGDQGYTLTCEVTASNSAGHETATSAGIAIPAGLSAGGPPAGGSSAGGGTSSVSPAETARLLARQLKPSGNATKITALLRRGGFNEAFNALEAGTAVIDWYEVPPGAKLAQNTKAKPVLVASGRRMFAAAGIATIKIKLTASGKSVLKHRKRIELTALATFTPERKAPITATATFVLKR